VGLRVPCARVGAILPGDFKIKAAKVRSIESFGMLCSARELGISEEASGLLVLPDDAPVGTGIRDYLGLDDKLFTLKLTPNRADCLSLLGVAREVAALTGADLALPAQAEIPATIADTRAVELHAPEACPRYCGRILRGINPRAATPDWMKQRVERSGIRSISAVVDITNYVMLELGQPLHAFDNQKLAGAIQVRMPKAGERLLLLNEQTITPDATTLLICDEEKVLAMAGIMGGEDSGVTDATTDVFLESAFFVPDAVAGKARALGFSSDASYRFERGVDFEGCSRAIERATQLVQEICGGQAGPMLEAAAPDHLPARKPIPLRRSRAERILGIPLEANQIATLLSGLDFNFQQQGEEFVVTPPSWRFDMEIEEDLIEDLARIHGYDNIPAAAPRAAQNLLPQGEDSRPVLRLKRLVAARDFQEVINYSFVDAAWEADFCANPDPVVLSNPIASQMGVMRSSMIGGLVANLSYNLKRRTSRVRVFEIGRCFSRVPSGPSQQVPGFEQPVRLGALIAGPTQSEQWGTATRNADFYDAKGDVEALLAPATPRFEKLEHPALHPGRSAAIVLDGRRVGFVGELHPLWVQKYELGAAPVVFELDLDVLVSRTLPAFSAPSRFPAVVRDLALLVASDLQVQKLLDGLKAAAPAIVKEVSLFDKYQGKGVEPDQKSLAFRVVMQDTARTLADAEVDAALQTMINAAADQYAAKLRT
ncbi:MAG: phenylalanine--tRNA ligase subunit beta, partial [Rhodocyclaceae bacterium]|nr:phenylalanine--tRNA ligase subunit beta [Rhodocyclaceae bacterium]